MENKEKKIVVTIRLGKVGSEKLEYLRGLMDMDSTSLMKLALNDLYERKQRNVPQSAISDAKQKRKEAKKMALQAAIDYINNISDSDFYALREKLVELNYIKNDEYTLDGDDSIIYKDVIGRNSAGYITLMIKSRTKEETEYSSSFDRKMLPELKNDLIKRNLLLQVAGINIEDYK